MKGNAAIKTSNVQTKATNKATAKIDAAQKALGTSLGQSLITCGI